MFVAAQQVGGRLVIGQGAGRGSPPRDRGFREPGGIELPINHHDDVAGIPRVKVVQLEARVNPFASVSKSDETTILGELAQRICVIGGYQHTSVSKDVTRLGRAHMRHPHNSVMCGVRDRLTAINCSGVSESAHRMPALVRHSLHGCMDLSYDSAVRTAAQQLTQEDF